MSYIEIGLTNTDIQFPVLRVVSNGHGSPSRTFRIGWDSAREIFAAAEGAVKGFECLQFLISGPDREMACRVAHPSRAFVLAMENPWLAMNENLREELLP